MLKTFITNIKVNLPQNIRLRNKLYPKRFVLFFSHDQDYNTQKLSKLIESKIINQFFLLF